MPDNLTFFPMREFENLDLEAMSDAELVALQDRILAHMNALGEIEPEAMGSGGCEAWEGGREGPEDSPDV